MIQIEITPPAGHELTYRYCWEHWNEATQQVEEVWVEKCRPIRQLTEMLRLQGFKRGQHYTVRADKGKLIYNVPDEAAMILKLMMNNLHPTTKQNWPKAICPHCGVDL